MPDDRKRCWLMEGCPSKTGVCYSCVPDGDDCPIWRWFKKQIVVRCKDCIHWDKWHTEECDNSDSVCFHNGWCKPDWFCADGERKDNDA